MSGHEWHIGICGTFDVENYGDLLFPLIAEAELRRRLGAVTLHRFSYRPKALPDWPYPVRTLAELPEAAAGLDGMLIGGGDLARFDKGVAPGYGPLTPAIHHPTGYWLTPALIAAQYNCPVVWNAIGVHTDAPAWAGPLLEVAIATSSYVAVRDEWSKQVLCRFGRTEEINVVPDTAFGIARLLDGKRPSADYVRLREALGLAGPYIVVQATEGLEAFVRLAREHPGILEDYRLVILPIGPLLGDDVAVFGDELPGSIRVSEWPGPLLIAELIGQAAAVVGISLHLAITALAFGVPVFRPATEFDGKYASLLGFDTVIPFDTGPAIDPRWFAAQLGRTGISPTTHEANARLSAYWDNVASIFAAGRSPAALEPLADFWQSVPGWLESWAERCSATLAARDAALAERDMWAMRHAAALDERDVARAERDGAITERDARAIRHAAVLDERNAALAERDAALAERDSVLAERDAAITEREARAIRCAAALAERDVVYNSNSWKLTRPLRVLRRKLRRQRD